jgi:hypothetical protein
LNEKGGFIQVPPACRIITPDRKDGAAREFCSSLAQRDKEPFLGHFRCSMSYRIKEMYKCCGMVRDSSLKKLQIPWREDLVSKPNDSRLRFKVCSLSTASNFQLPE